MEYHYTVWYATPNTGMGGRVKCAYKGTVYQEALLCLNTRRGWGYAAQLDRWTFEHGTERLSTDQTKWERF